MWRLFKELTRWESWTLGDNGRDFHRGKYLTADGCIKRTAAEDIPPSNCQHRMEFSASGWWSATVLVRMYDHDLMGNLHLEDHSPPSGGGGPKEVHIPHRPLDNTNEVIQSCDGDLSLDHLGHDADMV